MANKMKDLGELMQIAYVPQDFDAAIDHWVGMGAGPFFVLKGNQAEWCRAYGTETELVLDMAFGNWGDMQIEIIRQVSGGPTIYSDWFDAKKEGVHHHCVLVDDMARAKDICKASGCDIVHEGKAGGAEWIYVDTHGGDGTLLEILYQPPSMGEGLAGMTRAAARDWDGTDPIRELTLG